MKEKVVTDKDIECLKRSLSYGLYQYDENYKKSSKFLDITNININHINVSRRERTCSDKSHVDIDVVLCQEDLKYKQMVFDKTYTKIVSILTGTLKNDRIVVTCNIFLCLKENQDPDVIYTPYEDCYIKDVFKISRKVFFKWIQELNIVHTKGVCPNCGHSRFDACYITKSKVEYDQENESFEVVGVIYEPERENTYEPDMIKCENCGYKIKRFLEE